MLQVIAIFRFITIFIVLILGTLLVLLLGLVPFRTSAGGRLATIPVQWMARSFLWVFNINFHCLHPQRLTSHAGLVVPNHLSYADIALLLSVAPVRFLSTAGVKNIPLIGWVARAIETVFVNRGNQESRDQARNDVSEKLSKQTKPPVVIFPEGGTGPGDWIVSFRHGTFEIALESQVDVLPCVIRYEPLAAFHYFEDDDNLPKAVWRLATQPGQISAFLEPLAPLPIRNYDDARALTADAQQAIATELGVEVGSSRTEK